MKKTNGKKVMLVILDGWGVSPIERGNATFLAKTPTLDYVYSKYPKMLLSASGLEVGLNRNEMGNSEVGHLNLGTGRVVWENLPRIDYAIENGELENNGALLRILDKAKEGKLHLIGLVSPGGIHSHINHLIAILKMAKERSLKKVYIHFISDGRDAPAKNAEIHLKELEKEMKKIGVGNIATIIGRYFAMDRDERWDRTEKAYNLIVGGAGEEFQNGHEALESNYQKNITDEFIEPCVIDKAGTVESGDSIVFFNFRSDRMRQLVQAFLPGDFNKFERKKISSLNICTMTEYDRDFKNVFVIFDPINLSNTLADEISENGLSQYHVAETEKYPHVTYFFNGGIEKAHSGEKQIVVPSPKVATYDLQPEMSIGGVTKKVESAIIDNEDFIVVNFANGDMVGHTGVLDAGIKACESVDFSLAKILRAASNKKYYVAITADHGNCEIMIDPANGGANKEHTTSPVPFVYLDFEDSPFRPEEKFSFSRTDLLSYSSEKTSGVLADVAPTLAKLMLLPKISEMSGSNLIDAF